MSYLTVQFVYNMDKFCLIRQSFKSQSMTSSQYTFWLDHSSNLLIPDRSSQFTYAPFSLPLDFWVRLWVEFIDRENQSFVRNEVP